MTMGQLEAGLELVRQHGAETQFVGGKPGHVIESAERALGLTFPPTYKRFLEELGAGGAGAAEFYGLVSDNFENSAVPDGVWLTLDERLTSRLPPSLIIVGETGDGFWYALDATKPSGDGEYAVVMAAPLPEPEGPPMEVVAKDFGEFFLDQLSSAFERQKRRNIGHDSKGD